MRSPWSVVGFTKGNNTVPGPAALSAAVFQCVTFVWCVKQHVWEELSISWAANFSRSPAEECRCPVVLCSSWAQHCQPGPPPVQRPAQSSMTLLSTTGSHLRPCRWLARWQLLDKTCTRQPSRPSPQAETSPFECCPRSYSRKENCFKTTEAGYSSTPNIQASKYRFCQDDYNYTKALKIQLSLKYKFCPAAASSLVWWKLVFKAICHDGISNLEMFCEIM